MSDDQKAKACEIKYPTKYVKLNVGGSFFYTTVAVLTKHDTLLQSMFNDGQADTLKDSDGCIGIDRCGKHFGTILDFLRDGSISLPDSRKDIAELLVEANYFRVNVLAELCQKILTKEENETELICRVPLVTSSNEAGYLISSTTKPVVKLLINRHNNKYSYTNTSDDNLLRNMELFDKLSLRFKGGVVFIKDVDDISEEICCWSFYKDGINCATVCCTSNVYETDKMYTKVEFPEARINEETDIITRNVVML